MAKTQGPGRIPAEYINSLKDRIPINELYTHVTGVQFIKDGSRLRACNAFRQDNHPSLTYWGKSNTLTDYGEQSNYTNKMGKIYNHIDILIEAKVCRGFYDAVQYLANYLNETIPSELLKPILLYTKNQDALYDVYNASRNTMDSMFFENTDSKTSLLLRAYCEVRKIPFDRKFFDLLEIGLWPAKSIIESILKKYDIDTDKKNDSEFLSLNRLPDIENRGIVFPLYNKHGALVGISLRNFEMPKGIWRSILPNQTIAMYGLNYAISCENINIAEGEMSRVQVAARLWDNPELAAKSIHNMFTTGSLAGNSRLPSFMNQFKRVNYYPDIQLKDIEKPFSKETIDNVLEVYNNLHAANFNSFYWDTQRNGYDLDDYLREHIDDGKNAFFKLFKSHTIKKSMPEFIKATIEQLVLEFPEVDRDSARFTYCDRFAERLYNGADQNILKALYSHLTHVDREKAQKFDSALPKKIGDSPYFTKDNCYFVEEAADKSQPNIMIKSQISEFAVRGMYKMVSQKGRFKGKTEELDVSFESAIIYACIVYPKSEVKKYVVFEPDDLVDSKKFWSKLYKADIDLAGYVKVNRESEVFFCVKNTLATTLEKFSFQSPGPHIKTFTQDLLQDTLRPSLFQRDGTLKTYLNKYVSVIEGKVCENKYINIDLSSSQFYKFGTCNESDLCEISQIVWTKLRDLHDRFLVDLLLGFAFSTPIKHILDSNINGLEVFLLGSSNSHKTSLARIIQNFYGDFATDEKVLAFSNQTPKHLEAAIQQAGACICVCDEFKVSKEYTVEILNHFHHNIYNGKSRGRLNKNSEMVDINYFNANVITTAEYTQELETSAEARYLRFDVPEIETEEIFKELNNQKILSRFKCFTPYLIAWQHNNMDTLIEKYLYYRKAIEDSIKDAPNKGRVGLQLSVILTGFYSFCKFIQSKNICSEEEADVNIQRLFTYFLAQAKKQVARSADVRLFIKFKEILAEGLMNRSINMMCFKYDQNGNIRELKTTQTNNSVANVMQYRLNPLDAGSVVYTIISYPRLLLDIQRAYNITMSNSLKIELAQHGLLQLDAKGNIPCVRIPDLNDLKSTKPCRAIVIPSSVLYDNERQSDDREPQGF